MKKISAMLFALVLGLSLLFCRATVETQRTKSPPVLSVWCWDPVFNIYAMKEAEKIYQRTNPDFRLQVIETPWNDLQQKVITSLSARATENLPDILLMQDNAIQKNVITYPEAFVALNDHIDFGQFAQFKVDVGMVGANHYAVPFDNGSSATFIRRDFLDRAGLSVSDFTDITWERFIELGMLVKQSCNVAMLSMVANEPDLPMLMLQSAGTWMFDEEGKPFIKDNAVLKQAMLIIKQMVESGLLLLVPDWNSYIATLHNGTVAATVNGCWITASIQAEKRQHGLWAVTNTPRLSGFVDSVNYSSQGGSSWMVLSSSNNKELAIDFLAKTFAGSVELYETILPASGAIATYLKAEESLVYSQPIEFFGGQRIYEDLMYYASKVPKVRYGVFNYEARDAIARSLSEILQGASIEASLAKAQRNVEFLMSE